MELTFDYSKTPPAWLGQWLAEREATELFAPKLREYAWRALRQAPLQRMEWTADSLTAMFGAQRPAWRLRHDHWVRSCTCGYVNDRCVHTFLLARIFFEVLKKENWLHSGAPPGSTPIASRLSPPQAARALRPTERMETLPLFGAAALGVTSGASQKLEVEVDFHVAPGYAAIRFYLYVGNERRLLRIQQVLNLGLRVRNSTAAGESVAEVDRRFLNWLTPQLNQPAHYRDNLQVHKIPRTEFATWLEMWEDYPDRFIERSTQTPISRSGASGVGLFFELANVGDQVEIGAVIVTPGGKSIPFPAVFNLLAGGKRQMVLDGRLLDFQPPIPWETLTEIFAHKAPRMHRRHIPEHLPTLLDGRLDLLRGAGIRREEAAGTVTLTVKPDGADILLRASIGETAILPDSDAAAGRITAAGDQWLVTTYTTPHFDAVRRFLRRLPLTQEEHGVLRLSGAPEQVQVLVDAWKTLPGEIARVVAPELAPLLGPAAALAPELHLRDGRTFVDVNVTWTAGSVRVLDGELRDILQRGQTVLRTRGGGWLQLDLASVRHLRQALTDAGLAGDAGGDVRLFRPEAASALRRGGAAANAPILFSPASELLARRLRTDVSGADWSCPAALDSVLREYQKQGVAFLADRARHRVGAILADDMGLGKTLQVLALIQGFVDGVRAGRFAGEKQDRGSLVVAPASVVAVWLDQAARFCPGLRIKAYEGTPERRAAILTAGDWDVLVANYAIVRNDAELLLSASYDFVVLDEAQQIKNPDALIAQTVFRLRTPRPLALTGTPLENRLLDLWSIMNFVNPGFLGDRDVFSQRYEGSNRRGALAKAIAPVILRRLKETVARELPPRTEEVLRVRFGEEQQRLYDAELLRAREVVKSHGPIEILAALTRLRQLCCHPELLLKQPSAAGAAKLDELLELVTEVMDEGHSILVFSQFTEMLAIIQREFETRQIAYLKITGETPTPERARLVQEFTDNPAPQAFLLSLRAAGTGLTLTKADYVVIYDPWWNPAVERQAIDRTHRIGQDKPVMAYRLVAEGTVEDKILALQQEKAELFAAVMADSERSLPPRLTAADFARLLG